MASSVHSTVTMVVLSISVVRVFDEQMEERVEHAAGEADRHPDGGERRAVAQRARARR